MELDFMYLFLNAQTRLSGNQPLTTTHQPPHLNTSREKIKHFGIYYLPGDYRYIRKQDPFRQKFSFHVNRRPVQRHQRFSNQAPVSAEIQRTRTNTVIRSSYPAGWFRFPRGTST